MATSNPDTYRGRRVTTPELAEIIGFSQRTIAYWRKQRRIPFIRVTPRTIWYDVDAVLAALERGRASEGLGAVEAR